MDKKTFDALQTLLTHIDHSANGQFDEELKEVEAFMQYAEQNLE